MAKLTAWTPPQPPPAGETPTSASDTPTSTGQYAVVIDYKSASEKTLDLLQIYNGLALQLPVYALVARELAGLHPVAALYMPLGLKRSPAKPNTPTPDPGSEEFFQKFKPRGLVNADHAHRLDHALSAAEEKRSSPWYQLKFNKDGSIPKLHTDLLDAADFQTLLEFTRHKVAQLADSLATGQIAPAPCRSKGQTPCDYCDYVSLCPFDPARDPFREITKLPPEQILQQMHDAL